MRRVIMLFLLAITSFSGAQADFTGNDLLQRCGSEALSDQTFCLGYIAGVLDSYRDLNGTLEPGAGIFCEPSGSTGRQYAAVIVKYLNENPERLHARGSYLALTAMTKAFPCQPAQVK